MAEPVELPVALSTLEKRLAGVERQLDLLVRCILTDELPPEVQRMKLRRKAAITMPTASSAARARVGRAAKRNGMTRDAWVAKYGERETNP